MFMEKLSNEFNTSYTENGALGYRTTQSALLDMNFKLTSYRHKTEAEILSDFEKVWEEDNTTAILFLFYIRDVRGGAGERRLFNICFKQVLRTHGFASVLAPLVPEYGRWSDLFEYLDIPNARVPIFEIVRKQFFADISNLKAGKPISLLAKWMPSENCSNKKRRELARDFALQMGMPISLYRKTLSELRRELDLVETSMSAKKFDSIDYKKVPARANLKYREAFLRNDPERRTAFLNLAMLQADVIKAGTLFPHEITRSYCYYGVTAYDPSLEALWKNLPDFAKGRLSDTLVVRDGSASMTWSGAMDVANALSIYFSERMSPPFKDTFITFSDRPQLVSLVGCKSLQEKLKTLKKHDDISNTNIEAVFNLILDIAVKNELHQSRLPDRILILSDMEFDEGVSGRKDAKLFESFAEKYRLCGYQLPKLVFWNIDGRTDTIPLVQNENGVVLLSGYSPAIISLVLSNETDPLLALKKVLYGERYKKVWDAVLDVFGIF